LGSERRDLEIAGEIRIAWPLFAWFVSVRVILPLKVAGE
jgi:hypothetical protein